MLFLVTARCSGDGRRIFPVPPFFPAAPRRQVLGGDAIAQGGWHWMETSLVDNKVCTTMVAHCDGIGERVTHRRPPRQDTWALFLLKRPSAAGVEPY